MTRPSRPLSYYDVLDACREPGCPICSLGRRAAARHLENVIYSGVNSVSLRATLRQSQGYCRPHAWQLPHAGEGAPLGIAIIYRDVLNTVRKTLEAGDMADRRPIFTWARLKALLKRDAPAAETAVIVQQLQPQAPCPACERAAEMEKLALIAVMDSLAEQDDAMLAALETAELLCLPHLRQALALSRKAGAGAALRQIALAKWATLLQELDEYARKRDERFKGEAMSPTESNSWERALSTLAGPPDNA